MAWNKLKENKTWQKKDGLGKALQITKALNAMGYTNWNRLEPGDDTTYPQIAPNSILTILSMQLKDKRIILFKWIVKINDDRIITFSIILDCLRLL